jgi:hypothetical protein
MTRLFLGAALALLASVTAATAHDVPNDVTVRAFLRAEGTRLRFVVRVPLDAMRDVDVPKRGQGFVDLARVDDALRHAATIWIIQNLELYEEDTRLGSPDVTAVRVSLPSDPSFQTYERAVAHVTGEALPPATELIWEQGLLDAIIDYPITSDRSRFGIRSDLRRLGIKVAVSLQVRTADGMERAFALHDGPDLVRLDPRWHQAALRFLDDGFWHVLDGPDHLLFLLCVVLPLRRLRSLVVIVTSFTVAHSVTLIASAYGLAPGALWVPPLVETLIAISIVFMAFENIVGALGGRLAWPGAVADARSSDGGTAHRAAPAGGTAYLDRRWIVTGLFGLVHGFGFSFALRDTLQFAGSHLLTSLLSFNVGVELAQLVVIGLACTLAAVMFGRVVEERLGIVIASAVVAHTGWHWTLERMSVLAQFPFPPLDAVLLASVIGWSMVALVVGGLVWAGRLLVAARSSARGASRSKPSYASRGGI